MKSKILMCLVLASCSTVQVSENKAKDVYTDVVKSKYTDVVKSKDNLISKDTYVCDYRYDKEEKKDVYFRYCDKDGVPLNGFVRFSDAYGEGNYDNYLLKNGKVVFKEFFRIRNWKNDNIRSYEFYDVDSSSTESSMIELSMSTLTCGDGVSDEMFERVGNEVYTYGKVKKDGVKLDDKLTFVRDNYGQYFYEINGKRQLNGYFEVLDCQDKVRLSFTLLNGKYDGEKIGNDSPNMAGGILKKTYKNGRVVSKSYSYILEQTNDGITYDKWEIIKNGDKWNSKYYLKDKLVKEMDYDKEPYSYY